LITLINQSSLLLSFGLHAYLTSSLLFNAKDLLKVIFFSSSYNLLIFASKYTLNLPFSDTLLGLWLRSKCYICYLSIDLPFRSHLSPFTPSLPNALAFTDSPSSTAYLQSAVSQIINSALRLDFNAYKSWPIITPRGIWAAPLSSNLPVWPAASHCPAAAAYRQKLCPPATGSPRHIN
jgi:hypothetical protein